MEREGYRGRGRGRGGRGGRDGGSRGGRDGGSRGGRTGGGDFRQHRPLPQQPQWRRSAPSPGYGNPSPPVSPWSGPMSPAVRAPLPQPRPQPPPGPSAAPVVRPPVAEIQKLKISEPVASPSSSSSQNATRCTPIKRPDRGGTLAIRTVNIVVNHFPVNFNPESIIRHYDIDVKPDTVPNDGRPVKLSKTVLSIVRNQLCEDYRDQFPLSMTAYDGEKNIFSAVELPTGKFNVVFPEGEDMKYRTYLFTIKLVSELKLCKLKDYLTGNLFSIPRDILQGMDVVMKENPTRRMISVGRSFHPVEPHPDNDLGYGLTASRGFQHGLKATSQGLALCLDYSVLAFRKRLPVIDFLREHINFDVNGFSDWRRVGNALKGLKVTVIHRQTKQKYSIVGLTRETTRFLSFPLEDREGRDPPRDVRLVDYFREKYGMDIMYQDIPCLDLGRNNKKNHVPMEFCVLVEGQIYPKESLDRDTGLFLKEISLAKPGDRQSMISQMVRSRIGPCGGEIARNFGIDVNTNMTNVVGRVLGPPELKLGARGGKVSRITVDNEKCHWNLVGGRAVVEGKRIDRWAVVDFSASERYDKLNQYQFIDKIIARCKTLGMDMEEPVLCERASMRLFSNVGGLYELLEEVTSRAYKFGKGRLQILICVMSRKDPGYKYLKWISETKVGVVTQCCLSKIANKGQDQYFANLALKINAKLGGSNAELIDSLPYFKGEDHVMFVGADVNHPGASNKTSPSIAAVVATVNWPAVNRYVARVRPQDHRTERILNFADMCLELVKSYVQLNKVRPHNIVVFRDGVSESQFDMVLNEELVPLKMAFESMDYYPTITLIVAQKRHQTRLFPKGKMDGTSSGNVPPGTVVDTTIVHPFEFDFYLCSHYGSLGTSKPTHYHVLWDEHRFTSDQLQKLIYNMCFTFARCTKPVSLVPPVYYADLVAYRGRLYHEAVMEGQSPASVSSSSSSLASTSLSSEASFDERFYKLHTDLENIMYFV